MAGRQPTCLTRSLGRPATSASCGGTSSSSQPHAALLEWYRQLIRLRRAVLGAEETRFADVSCAIGDGGSTFEMRHRGITVSADLEGDTVTVSAPGIPDLAFP